MKKMQIPTEILENYIHDHTGKGRSYNLLNFPSTVYPIYLSKTASKSWQYHTLMVLQSSAKSCTPSKPRVNIVSSSVMNIWPFVTTLVRKETKYLIIQFGTLPSIGNARNPERDNCSLESTIKSFQCCTWE